jgi:predicted nucleic acid-binding protein
MPFPADAAWDGLKLASEVPGAVLDTNVVLDWLVFAEPTVAALAAAAISQRLRWLATSAMRDELAHVLDRGLAARCGCDTAAMLARWDAHALTREPAPPALGLVCTDRDDQKFIDLAVGARARWLVTRDKAVLKLARRAHALGLSIVTPERWQNEKGGPQAAPLIR